MLNNVPIGKYQRLAVAQPKMTHQPDAGRMIKTIKATSQTRPKNKCRHLMKVLRGSNPNTDTIRAMGQAVPRVGQNPVWCNCQ